VLPKAATRWSPISSARCSVGLSPLPQLHWPNSELPSAAKREVPQPRSLAAWASGVGARERRRDDIHAQQQFGVLVGVEAVVGGADHLVLHGQFCEPRLILRSNTLADEELLRDHLGARPVRRDQLVDSQDDRSDETEEQAFLVGDRHLLRAFLAPPVRDVLEVDSRNLSDSRLPGFLGVAEPVEEGEHVLVITARHALVRGLDLRHRPGCQEHGREPGLP
jgi:hypothetical protein